jgi:hypothetical protein
VPAEACWRAAYSHPAADECATPTRVSLFLWKDYALSGRRVLLGVYEACVRVFLLSDSGEREREGGREMSE